MIELLFVACLATSNEECREQSLLFDGVSMQTCMTLAQLPLSEWASSHPNWTIERWSCHVPDDSVRI